MANFKPINHYTYYLLDKLIIKYGIKQPFLDAGCGIGDLSVFLGKKGWAGQAIDYSDQAVLQARKQLKKYSKIKIRKQNLLDEKGKYNSVFLWDVLEHFDNDDELLSKFFKILNKGSYLIMAIPSNPREWRWDDDLYGHFRRYDLNELKNKLNKAGFSLVEVWEFTFPFFWLMRRIYTFLKKPKIPKNNKEILTKNSSTTLAWKIPYISEILNNTSILWMPVYLIQYYFFRSAVKKGFAFLVVARKKLP